MNKKIYTIDDLLVDSPIVRAVEQEAPAFVSADGSDSVDPKAFGSGELLGNVTVQDGYLQSKDYVAGVSGWRLTPTSGDFNFPILADEVHVPDQVTVNSFHVDADGDAYWGTTPVLFDADNENAIAYVLKTGVAKFKNIILSGSVAISGIANNTATDISILEKTHNIVFSVTDADTIAWASGTVTLSNGRTFSISAGNTGNMTALTYIYIDPAVSSTVLQTTTTYSTAVGANKILLGTAQNNTVTASFIPYGPGQPLIDGANIGALSIVANNIAASTITATKMNVSQLSAIAADIGAITAGSIALNSAGFIRGGQTAYNTGAGFFLGYSGAAYKFSVGDPAGDYLTFDGSVVDGRGSLSSFVSLSTYENLDGSSTPVAVTIMPDSTIVKSDASAGIDNNTHTGFVKKNAGQNRAQYLGAGSEYAGDDTFSHTIQAGTDRLLLVFHQAVDSVGTTVPTSMSWNGNALTKLGERTSAADTRNKISVWYYAAGSSGTDQTGSLTASGTVANQEKTLVALNYQYVNQSDPIGASSFQDVTDDASPSATITPEQVYSLLVGFLVDASANEAVAVDATMTGRVSITSVKTGEIYVYGTSVKTLTHTLASGFGDANMATVELKHSGSTSVPVQISGVLPGFTGLTIGSKYYVSDTPGVISATPGTTSLPVGIAVSSTELYVTLII